MFGVTPHELMASSLRANQNNSARTMIARLESTKPVDYLQLTALLDQIKNLPEAVA